VDSTGRWRGTEEAGDLDQPAVRTDFAKIDRRFPVRPFRAHQAPEEADQIVMHVDAAHELEPRAGPAGPDLGDVTAKGFTPDQRNIRIDIDAAVAPARFQQRVSGCSLTLVPCRHVVCHYFRDR